MLDGFILIFIGYNSSILTKIYKWEETKIFYLDINFHLLTALGGLLSLFMGTNSNNDSLNVAAFLTILAFMVSIALINVSNYYLYFSIFSIICFSNGHLQNLSVNSIVKKFNENHRAYLWGYAYFFNQFGKFLFATILNKYNDDIKEGKIDITVFPIFTLIMLQIVFIILILNIMKERSKLKSKLFFIKDNVENKLFNNRNNPTKIDVNDILERYVKCDINNSEDKDKNKKNSSKFILNKIDDKIIHENLINSQLTNNYLNAQNSNTNKIVNFNENNFNKILNEENIKNKNNENHENEIDLILNKNIAEDPENNKNFISNIIHKENIQSDIIYTSHINRILCNLKDIFDPKFKAHQFNLIFINLSLGIQFFSLINIFPHFNFTYTYSILTEEIFYSKLIHTIFLLFFPILFTVKQISRRILLLFAFTCNLVINFLILMNFLNSSIFVHLFRFFWNVCYVTSSLYCCEAAPKKIRFMNTSIMYLFFKISCMVEILVIDKLININLYLPVGFNLLILVLNIILVSKFEYETHYKSLDQIELEIMNNEIVHNLPTQHS